MGETVLKQLTNETNRMLDQVIRDLRRLPYDAEVEYLESTGMQWIDTGCRATGSLFWEIVAEATQTTQQRIGAIQTIPTVIRNHISIPEASNRIAAAGYNTSVGNSSITNISGVHTFRLYVASGTVKFSVDGVDSDLAVQQEDFDIGANYYIFARNNKTDITFSSMRIYSAKFFDDSTLVRDFIPVRLGTTGYLYDKVSGQLFGNAGTGEFVLGPDKKTTRDYVQDGLVAMWDGIENTREREHDPSATVWTDLINSYILSATAATDTWGSDHLQMGTTTWPIQASQKAAFISTINNVQNVGGQATIEMVLSHTNQSNKCIFGQMFRSFDIHSLGVREQVWFKNGSDINVGPTAGGLHSITITGERVGSTSNQYNTWYYNGENESSATRVFNTNDDTDPQALGIGLGQYPSRGIATANIYSIRIYNRVLSAEEVAANFAIDKARFKIS